ncbi:MAG: ATP-binding protein [Chloroflexota bacterium]|nr:ATP-binding protein [Chloroflexota bacterium]
MNVSTAIPTFSYAQPVDISHSGPCGHAVQFYDDDAFLLNELSRFIGSAIEAGDAGVVVATREHREGLAQRLKARGVDVELAVEQGRYVAFDAAEMLSKLTRDGQPDPTIFSDVIGGVLAGATSAPGGERRRVAVFGEMVALLWAEGKADVALQLEGLWNDLAQTHAFDLLCAYPMNFFTQSGDGAPLGRICETHSRVIPSESYTSLVDEEDRLRAIAILQQKAQALESEIEERKRVEQSLRERNEELRTAVAARDEFLSVAAHELKTPVTSLRGYAQLLLRDVARNREISPERLRMGLDTIDAQTGKLSHLVARLLDTAQIEAGKLRVEPVRTDLAALVRSAVAQQSESRHTVLYEGPERLEVVIDPVRFEQVITNLLQNAVKFSPEGGVVKVELRQAAPAGALLSVTDSGVGIPADQREAVFERFHQAHSEGHLSGMGLGLYITREIVAMHGGLIWVEEPEHGGSRFVVALPSRPVTR